ncbi:ankyrin repeat domain-containing protein [Paenibacillus sp. 1001270B_150601_E10]|uniref:ankyrin repeat domain-containing protein n=1 Tax=Paenibacillus sp. 1001270B_150601_E10 TaxID=2787079 RepID=UPI0018A100BF|nr:ankyrin repeat domain-containing protein [Paenibacillus sp. 1001270B_150601_E10]
MLRALMIALFLLTTGCLDQSADLPAGEVQQAIEGGQDMKLLNDDLIEATLNRNQVEIKQLIQEGADINTVDASGRTPAMIAVHHKQLNVFNLLVELGADINIRDQRSDNPLLYASAEGMLDIVKAALAANADTTLTNRFGGTALIPAADRGHVDIVEELLEHSDVNVNHVNNLGWTALLEAVILGDGGERHQHIVELLIQHGADVNLADGDGITPLQHAKQHGYTRMIDMLTAAGAQ